MNLPIAPPAAAADLVPPLALDLVSAKPRPGGVVTKLSAKPRLAGVVTKRLYCVRHGQALHNVVEDDVKRQAAAEALTLGHAAGSPDFDAFLKQARLDALSDEALADPGLSGRGKEQLAEARVSLERSLQGHPKPTAVLVSPLLRTLQSSAILFPGHGNARVCEMLRERKTGLPCDEVASTTCYPSELSHIDFDDCSPMSAVSCISDASTCLPGDLEDAAALRARTAGLTEVLLGLEDEAVCVVSHKGWLREFERGPLGRDGAKEFKPGEVRAFDLRIHLDGCIEATAVALP